MNIAPSKDLDRQGPVASAWRKTLHDVVQAMVEGDYALLRGMANVVMSRPGNAEHSRRYVADYGETLRTLPEDAWSTSVAMWMATHWDVFIDLWTVESGRSDMVLEVKVWETGDGYRYDVGIVYVP